MRPREATRDHSLAAEEVEHHCHVATTDAREKG